MLKQSAQGSKGYNKHFLSPAGRISFCFSGGSNDHKSDQTWWTLRLTYGLVAFLAGLDKFFNLLANWESYVAPALGTLLPVSATSLMRTVGVIEMLVGILILTNWTRIGAYVASAWLLLIALTLPLTGSHFDVAVRDVAMAVGAWTLARLTEVRRPADASAATSPIRGSARAEA